MMIFLSYKDDAYLQV